MFRNLNERGLEVKLELNTHPHLPDRDSSQQSNMFDIETETHSQLPFTTFSGLENFLDIGKSLEVRIRVGSLLSLIRGRVGSSVLVLVLSL